MPAFAPTPHPYYIHAPQPLGEGSPATFQQHMLCHQLNAAGFPAYLVGAPSTNGALWTPTLSAQTMAAHHIADRTPISIQSHQTDQTLPGLRVILQSSFHQASGDLHSQLLLAPAAHATDAPEPPALPVLLPWFDPRLLQALPPAEQGRERKNVLVYSGRLPAAQFKLRAEHAQLTDISPYAEDPLSDADRWDLLLEARYLYAYTAGRIVTEARLLGCEVIYVSNDHQLQTLPEHPWDTWGTSLNQPGAAMNDRPFSSDAFRQALSAFQDIDGAQLRQWVDITQNAAAALPSAQVWTAGQLQDLEDWIPSTVESRAARADAQAQEKLSKAYADWRDKATPTEIYSDICAELVTAGKVRAPVVHLFAHGRPQDALADTMDALAASWLQPRRLIIHADYAPPIPPSEIGADVQWMETRDASRLSIDHAGAAAEGEWVVLLEAGTRIEPFAFIELLSTAGSHPGAQLVYAASDITLEDGRHLPQFTGGINIEWLKGTNYLGGVVAARRSAWQQLPDCDRFVGAYRLALRNSRSTGIRAVHYVDKVLSHSATGAAADQESQEFSAALEEVRSQHPSAELVGSDLYGCWNVKYPDPGTPMTLVVPTGKQLGYLRSLLLSTIRYFPDTVQEAVLVVQEANEAAMVLFVEQWDHAAALPLKLVRSGGGAYNHARSINLGLQAASTDLVVVCDDDVEWLDAGSLTELRRLFSEESVAVAAPRLVLQKGARPMIVGGPHIPGEDAQLLNYLGERQGLTERGYLNRLQMPQDVGGFSGSCWMTRRSAVLAVGGLDEVNTPLLQSAADLGYRLQQAGWRLVWTPRASALHAGGATLNAMRRHPTQMLTLSQSSMQESHYLRNRWLDFAGQHPLYSKHFSGAKAYALDTHLISNWTAEHHTRPRVLALPLRSGSGQYRVIEPLDALQYQSKAETCVIEPEKPGQTVRRVLTPLDVARHRPDRILVQHSISDQDITNLRNIRDTCPTAFIVQLMDDLTSDLPMNHPNFVFGQREGHVRTLQALELSDRLIVSTQPLADYYARYCRDIRLVPNALDPQYWGQLVRTEPSARKRLRVGWAGAAQHLGDLRLVERVVRALADEVDWIFMGMCPDELRPYVKEFHKFVSYKHYPAKLASLDLDIAIAPLENNLFNACKSNLRLLEYGAMGWPVVCSDVYPYQTDNPPVIRVPDDEDAWLQALRRLIDDGQLRHAQGRSLHSWLQQHYLLERHVDAWFHAIFD